MKRKGMTARRFEQAVALSWEHRGTKEEFAKTLGVGRRTLYRWRQTPEFRARMAALSEEFRAETLRKMQADVASMHRG